LAWYFQAMSTFSDGVIRMLRRHAGILIPAVLFFTLTVAINWQLFVTPMVPWGDTAINALQVEHAKHFHALLGNYSRWHFHHPGPFLFYVFAAGEALFYNWLHVVPAPLNGECLAEIAFSTACLFAAIYVFWVHTKRTLFLPLAVSASVLFLYAVDSGLPGSAMTSLWLPYAPLFCFLLFIAACASVAAGTRQHLPLLAVAGMIMIHAHVVQLFFVTLLASAALLIAALRTFRRGNFLAALRANKAYLLAALAIVAIFLLPIAIDWAVDHPNNIHQIRLYLREHHAEHNSIRTAILYTLSFFTYDVHPAVALARPGASIRDLVNPAIFVRIYWACCLFILAVATFVYLRPRRKMPTFLNCVFLEMALSIILFVYWGSRITGGMFNFDGYFFYSVQLFGLLGLCSLISLSIRAKLQARYATACACVLALPLLLVAGVKNSYSADPAVAAIVSSLKAKHKEGFMLRIQSDQAAWPTAAGVATSLTRLGKCFCVGSGWEFMFGPQYVCNTHHEPYVVSFSKNMSSCKAPCVILYGRSNLHVTGAPDPAFLAVPMRIEANDSLHESRGFDVIEGDRTWSSKRASLRFFLAPAPTESTFYVLTITGSALPGRPVTIEFNGARVGSITQPGVGTNSFRINRRLIGFGRANVVTLDVPSAGPVGSDPRELGYLFKELTLQSAISNP
ncbi:MAG: hypothetical protein ACREBW_08070, partial [Candidatus Micrarchaeaceae archaeon]